MNGQPLDPNRTYRIAINDYFVFVSMLSIVALAAIGLGALPVLAALLLLPATASADTLDAVGNEVLGDTVPLNTLLSRSYAAERRALISDAASYELRPGSPDGREPVLPKHIIGGPAVQVFDPSDPV